MLNLTEGKLQNLTMITEDSEDLDSEATAAVVAGLVATVEEVKGNILVRPFSLV